MRAIVTGGTRGIGLSIARAIVAAGGRVMITGRSQRSVDEALATLPAAQGAAVDVRDRAAVDALVVDTARQFGGLDTLINNAAIGSFADIASTTDEEWHGMIETNLTGVFYCTRAAIPAIKSTGGGSIINIASLAGRHPFARGAAYCATKAALISFTESLMQEVRHDDIRVCVVMPGSVATEFDGKPVTAADDWKLSPDDVAEVVMDLLRHPGRSLPSKVEIRPSRPPQKKG